MNKIRITAVRQTIYHDLIDKYENPIEHTCDVREGQQWISVDGQCPQKALQFLSEHNEIAFATCEGNLPKMRIFQIMKQERIGYTSLQQRRKRSIRNCKPIPT